MIAELPENFQLLIDDIYETQQFKCAFMRLSTQLNLVLKRELVDALSSARTVKLASLLRQDASDAARILRRNPYFNMIKFAEGEGGAGGPGGEGNPGNEDPGKDEKTIGVDQLLQREFEDVTKQHVDYLNYLSSSQEEFEKLVAAGDLKTLEEKFPDAALGLQLYSNNFSTFDSANAQHRRAVVALFSHHLWKTYKAQNENVSIEGFKAFVNDQIAKATGDSPLTAEDFGKAYDNFKREAAKRGFQVQDNVDVVSAFVNWFSDPDTPVWPKLALLLGVPLTLVGVISTFVSEEKAGPILLTLLGLGSAAYGFFSSPLYRQTFGADGLTDAARAYENMTEDQAGITEDKLAQMGYPNLEPKYYAFATAMLRKAGVPNPEDFLQNLPDKAYATDMIKELRRDRWTTELGKRLLISPRDSDALRRTKFRIVRDFLVHGIKEASKKQSTKQRDDQSDLVAALVAPVDALAAMNEENFKIDEFNSNVSQLFWVVALRYPTTNALLNALMR